MTRLPERMGTGDLLIRRWLVSDAEALERAIVDSAHHLRPWMGWMAEEPQTLEERRALIARWEKEWAQGGDAYLGVFVAGEVSGSCGLHRRRGPDVLEIGYWTHRALVRKGLATAVAGLLTNAAFTVPEITQVEIHHDKANVASAGVPRSLGYRLIGERPDRAAAPDEVGIDCVWRVERAGWSGHVPAWPSTPAAGST